MADNNKVRFGLKNVHYAKRTVSAGAVTYGTPVAIPGAVNLDLSPEGSTDPFYADNVTYYVAQANNGYSGSLEVAKIPQAMLTDIWGFTSSNDVLIENAETEPSSFALAFQIDGDATDQFHLLYNVSAARPNIGSATIEASKTPQTQTVDITAIADESGNVRAVGDATGTISTWMTGLLT